MIQIQKNQMSTKVVRKRLVIMLTTHWTGMESGWRDMAGMVTKLLVPAAEAEAVRQKEQ